MSDTGILQDRRLGLIHTNWLLKEKLLAHMPEAGNYTTDIDGFTIHRRDEINRSENCFYKPVVAVVVQGFKHSVIGNDDYHYGEYHCLISGVDMPSANYVTDAAPEKPFLVMSLDLNQQLTTQLAAEMPSISDSDSKSGAFKGIAVAEVDPDVLDAFLRLMDLLDRPEQISVLAPMIIREIHYRLLIGPQGAHLRMINTVGTQSHQVFQAITWLRQNFKKPLQVDKLARKVNMAPSTFHRHFRCVTTLSPLQYQKRLRLYEAQRLMLTEHAPAANAGLAVGYESPTQFNREYKRLFGEPPHRNVSLLR